jgi:glycosyltransferase involved in cell wall biosynthesis
MALKDKHIFILGMAKFNTEVESTIYTLAKHLAKDNYVYYIENPFTWKDILLKKSKHDAARIKQYYSSAKENIIHTDNPNLKVVVMPPMASINWLPEGKVYRGALKMNQEIMRKRIQQVIKKHNIDNYIFINSFNFYYPDLGTMLSPDLLVYHCVDPLIFPVDRRHGLFSEAKMVKDSHLVICTSKQLYDEKSKVNKNTFFIPNAADINHSSKALQPGVSVHNRLKDIKRPIAGYFGNIERRLDYQLLDKVTAANPDISFVFCGPVSKEFVPSWFYERANVHLTGPVPYNEMPGMLKGFDVATIPFKKDDVSATIFPLKLFEYLGSGKPVVATDFNPDLVEFTGNTVSYCSDATAFSHALLNSLNNDSEQLKQQRIEVAARNTWEKRSYEFGAVINEYIGKVKAQQLSI